MTHFTSKSNASLNAELTLILEEQEHLSLYSDYPRTLEKYGDIWNTPKSIRALDDIISLVIRGADPKSYDGFSPFILAISQDRPDRVDSLLRLGFDPKQTSRCFQSQKISPLIVAASFRNHETIRMLLDAGANPNAKTTDGFTPLHKAVESGDIDSCRLLIHSGADPNYKNIWGNTPAVAIHTLPQSKSSQKTVITKMLLEAGAQISPSNLRVR